MKNRISQADFPQFIMLAIFLALLGWSAVCPFDRRVWWVEISSVLAVFALFALSHRWFKFSNISYFFVFLWLCMHTVGAHYSFERVPFGLITDTFGFERNHYDRVAHFAVGMCAYTAAEVFFKTRAAGSAKSAAFFGILFMMALANAWELIEWAYAEADGGEVGAAFLGSQGDVWDAQKDMLCDTLGAIAAAPLFPLFNRPKFAAGNPE